MVSCRRVLALLMYSDLSMISVLHPLSPCNMIIWSSFCRFLIALRPSLFSVTKYFYLSISLSFIPSIREPILDSAIEWARSVVCITDLDVNIIKHERFVSFFFHFF